MLRVAFYTLGCKVNQYESNATAQAFRERGDCIVPYGERADVVIINTCAVTEESERKGRQIVRRSRKQYPDAVLAVMGCLSQKNGRSGLEEADIVIGSDGKQTLPSLVDAFLAGRNPVERVGRIRDCHVYENAFSGHGERTRATVKIEDGCNNFCTYCIIPYLRGPVRSRPKEDALAEIRRLAADGYREIVLTGIHLDSYGKDLEKTSLADLLEEIEKIDGVERVRLGSLEPVFMSEANVRRLASCEKLCPQFHLSLQSGCARTLKAMNRHYTPQEFSESVAFIRRYIPQAALTTDVIVGFPGETEEDFLESLSFVKKTAFSKVHVFPYSSRPGTRAAEFPDPVAPDIRKRRTAEMLAVAEEAEASFLRSLIGKTESVLFERGKNGIYSGHCRNYAEVRVASRTDLTNRILPVLVDGAEKTYCTGRIRPDGK